MSFADGPVFSVSSRPRDGRRRSLASTACAAADRALGLDRLQRLYESIPKGLDAVEWIRRGIEVVGARVEVHSADVERVPRTGPAIVVANHPYGGIEGLILAELLRSARLDVKILANYLLGRIPELRDLFLLVDPFELPTSTRANLASLRRALRFVKGGGLLGAFPAGEVSRFHPRTGRVADRPWSPAIAGLARVARCPVVPVFFGGRNGNAFQALGMIHPLVRTALLPRELLRRRGTTIEVRIGNPIPYSRLEGFATDRERIAYLRDRVEILRNRRRVSVAVAVQPRRTPRDPEPIVAPALPDRLEKEVRSLPAEHLLVEEEGIAVCIAEAERIPDTLREIGRLREETFRAVGEGTGRELDLDPFDETYLHLWLWHRERREVVGAYRLGCTDRILAEGGIDGLYTSTLFAYRKRLFDAMGPALEMGRSWVRPEYQRSYAPLMLLWKGIGRFVVRHPRYATLFGPVSISAEYQSASQRLIVSFLGQNRFAHPWAEDVRPRTPFRPRRSENPRLEPARLRDLDDVSSFIAEIEADRKGVPILLRQYLRLEGRLLGFNVDPAFSNVLDVLILVDLRRTSPKILGRYFGREGLRTFQDWHGAAELRTG